jgi:hypothetical protein
MAATATPPAPATHNTAPDFPHYRTGEPDGYPSGGQLIGPAWQRVWDRLELGPCGYADLRNQVLAEWPIREKTLRNLLWQAEKAGFVKYTNQANWEHRTVRKAYLA